jgi:hypothetical protein
MGPGPGSHGRGVREASLDGASSDEILNEGKAFAQSGHREVAAIFAMLLRERGHQVVHDKF